MQLPINMSVDIASHQMTKWYWMELIPGWLLDQYMDSSSTTVLLWQQKNHQNNLEYFFQKLSNTYDANYMEVVTTKKWKIVQWIQIHPSTGTTSQPGWRSVIQMDQGTRWPPLQNSSVSSTTTLEISCSNQTKQSLPKSLVFRQLEKEEKPHIFPLISTHFNPVIKFMYVSWKTWISTWKEIKNGYLHVVHCNTDNSLANCSAVFLTMHAPAKAFQASWH